MLEEFTNLRYRISSAEGLGAKKLVILSCLSLIIEILADNKIAADFQLDALNQVYWDFMG